MVARAYQIANGLKEHGIEAEVINSRFLKPFDKDTVIASVRKTKKLVTIEDGILQGGLATIALEAVFQNGLSDIWIKNYGYPDEFIKHGKTEEIEKIYGLDVNHIIEDVLSQLGISYGTELAEPKHNAMN